MASIATSDHRPFRKSGDEICCIILAAGLSTRFGAIKQLEQLSDGSTIIQRAIRVASQSKCAHVVAVLGAHAEEILSTLEQGRAMIVKNPDFVRGISTTIKIGLQSVPDYCSAVILMVADQPNLESKFLDKMIDTYHHNRDVDIVALAYLGEPRNPVLISRRLFPDLMKLKGDRGANQLVRDHLRTALLINVNNRAIFADVDVPEDLRNV